MYNFSPFDYQIKKHDRVGQMILECYFSPDIIEIQHSKIKREGRGIKGFGSTGMN